VKSQRDVESSSDGSETARLQTFADAVIAIAITLLILEVAVPHVRPGELRQALLEQWHGYVAYAISFLTIGLIWIHHHHMFRFIRRSTHAFLILNLLFLMTIAVIPWPTALLAEHG
jgi:uncharacterized membrane protein